MHQYNTVNASKKSSLNSDEERVINHFAYISSLHKEFQNFRPNVKHGGVVTQKIGGYRYVIFISDKSPDEIRIEQVDDGSEDWYTGVSVKLNNDSKFIFNFDKWLSKLNNVGLDGKGFIYLVSDGHYTKIGATSYNVKKRLNELQTGNAKKLKIIDSYRVDHKITTERYLHEMFSEKRVLGEWFMLNDVDIHAILSNRYDIKKKNIFSFFTGNDVDYLKIIMTSHYADYNHKYQKMIKREFNKLQDRVTNYIYSLPVKDRLLIKESLKIAEINKAA
jgi:hypothetical protein